MRCIISPLFLAIAALTLPQGALAQVKVVASFSILGDLATQIGGEAVRVTTIVGPDQDAHVYSPTVADARAVAAADLVILNGLGFETWAADLVAGSGTSAQILMAAKHLPVVIEEDDEDHNDSKHRGRHDSHAEMKKKRHGDPHRGHHRHHMRMEGIREKHDHDDYDEDHDNHYRDDDHEDRDDKDDHEEYDHHHDHGEVDPHAWGAMANGIAYAAAIRDALSALDPDNSEAFSANFAVFEGEALAAQAAYAARVAALPADHRTVVTSHDAFGYLAKETGLTFLSPRGVNTAATATASQVRDLIMQLKALPHAAIFIENIANPALIQQISDETGLVIGGRLYSDALSETDGPASTYLDWYRHNMDTILRALETSQ